jgi:hypothetical protein
MDYTIFDYFESKAKQEAEAYELALSTYRLTNDGSIVPLGSGDSYSVFQRISNLVTPMGAKILNRKLDGVVGNVVVQGSDRVRAIVNEYDVKAMAHKLARDLIVKGSAGLALSDDGGLYRLGGFIAALTDPYDVDKRLSIFQAQLDEWNRWTVRIYQGNLVQEWTGLRRLREVLSVSPTERVSAVSEVAFFADYQTDDSGVAFGELEQLAPLLKGIMAVDARIHRVSEIFGFPVAVIKGTIQEREGHSPQDAIIVSEGGDVRYLTPASLDNLINQKKDLMGQLDEIAILPANQRWGSEAPSGEALREANEAFNASIRRYAETISVLMTDAFNGLLEARGINEDVGIHLHYNRVQDADDRLAKAIERLEKGVLPISYVVRIIQSMYDDITPEEVQEIIDSYQARNSVITADDLIGL